MSCCCVCFQVDLTRLCWFKPNFVMDIEHSDEDLVALFAQLSERGKSDVAASLNPGMFRSNPSHQGNSTSSSSSSNQLGSHLRNRRSLRAKLDYRSLYTADDVARVARKYADDFTALGYSTNLDCV